MKINVRLHVEESGLRLHPHRAEQEGGKVADVGGLLSRRLLATEPGMLQLGNVP
jgi:hypothetical protein